ncbi:MAG: hypothetical protein U0798_02155 [Gemmataceae bacterium]
MRRLFRPMFGAFLVSASCAALVVAQTPPAGTTPPAGGAPAKAPAQPTKDAPAAAATTSNFFPSKKGTKWVYKVAENSIEVAAGEGGKLDTLVGGKTVASETIEVKADGIYRTKVNNVAIEPPVKILALPADKDANWTVESKLNGQAIKGKFTQKGAKEKVTVPAGQFDCVVVDGPDFDIAGAKCGIKYWFADGKYVVKMVYNIAGNEALLELKEFTEAK